VAASSGEPSRQRNQSCRRGGCSTGGTTPHASASRCSARAWPAGSASPPWTPSRDLHRDQAFTVSASSATSTAGPIAALRDRPPQHSPTSVGPAQGRGGHAHLHRVGAAQQVPRGSHGPATRPSRIPPGHAPPDPKSLRSGVNQDLGQLFLLLASVCLVIGAVGIANTTLVPSWNAPAKSDCAALSAHASRHVLTQFLTESAVLAPWAGSSEPPSGPRGRPVRDPPELDPGHPAGNGARRPVIGLATGRWPGSTRPGWAARIQPVEALRR